jgi:two-component system response regulator VicR
MLMKNLIPDQTSADGLNAGKRILIVEDDDQNREVLTEIFRQSGYTVKSFSHILDIGPEVTAFKPDLVLLDYLLPGINGGELCSQLKRDPVFRNLPVILLSAYDKVFLSLGNYGCDYFISKPFDISYLLACVNGGIESYKRLRLST